MSRDPESESKGWWQTLPGLLTATAGIITAITGLLIAVHQTGLFGRSSQPVSQVQGQAHPLGGNPHSTEAENPPASPTGVATSRPLALPDNTEVRFGQAVFTLLAARLDSYSPDKVSLNLTIRMTNNDRFDANFWVASFRLLVDGSLQAPTNDLDELVSAHSAKEGDVEFVIPANISTVGLQMGDVGEGKPTITLSLHPRQ